MKLKCNLILSMMYFMYYSLCCIDFAKKKKKNTKAHCGRKPSALLHWPVDPQITD